MPPHPLTRQAVAQMPTGDVYYTNAALCLPPRADAETYKTSDAKKKAAICCKSRLYDEIRPYANLGVPICATGGASCLTLTGSDEVTKRRGKWFQKGKVLVTWHPAYILRQPVRVGDLARDMQKLAYGKPRYEDIPDADIWVVDTPLGMEVFTSELIRMAQAGVIEDNVVCFDIETDNIDWLRDKILCISFSWDTDIAVIVAEELLYTEHTTECLIRLFDKDNGIKWVGHNVKFDMRFLRYQLGVHNMQVTHDSLLADYILDENRMHALKELLGELFDIPDYEVGLVLKYLKNKNDMYSKVPRPQLYHYAAYDTAYTLYLWRHLFKLLVAEGLYEQPYLYPVMAAQGPFLDIELHGMRVDRVALTKLSRRLRHNLDILQNTMEDMCGRDFNPNSYLQVGRIMYGHYKMPKYKARTKIGWSTAAAFRLMIKAHYIEQGRTVDECEPYRWIMLYTQWKTLEKLRNSYVDNMMKWIDENERVHPDILAYGTETGRPSVRNPALQTIPRTGTGEAAGEIWGKFIKRCFAAPEGFKILQVDYSQAELRTAAWMSRDPFLMGCYHDGRDIHGEVANLWFPGWNEMSDTDTMMTATGTKDKKTLRVESKKGVFARVYLGTEHAIAGILGIAPAQAKPYLKALDTRLAGLVSWEHEQFAHMQKYGYVASLTGRRRRFPLITRNNTDDARKAACNAPVQGMASDLTLMSMIDVHKWLGEHPELNDVHILITVHDSIILEVPDGLVDYIARNVVRIMEATGKKWMPEMVWKADAECGDNWGDLVELEFLLENP